MKGKGRGVVATQPFKRGQFVCEYSGELISKKEAEMREQRYSQDPSIGSYMYYFTHRDQHLWYAYDHYRHNVVSVAIPCIPFPFVLTPM